MISKFSGEAKKPPLLSKSGKTPQVSDFHTSEIPDELRVQMNGVSEIRKAYRPAWMKPERLERVIRSYEAFPDLDDFCQEMGYPSLQQMLDLHSPAVRDVEPAESGTICAFHTDDALYTEEANRFQSRLRDLGMKNDIKTVTSNGEWVAGGKAVIARSEAGFRFFRAVFKPMSPWQHRHSPATYPHQESR